MKSCESISSSCLDGQRERASEQGKQIFIPRPTVNRQSSTIFLSLFLFNYFPLSLYLFLYLSIFIPRPTVNRQSSTLSIFISLYFSLTVFSLYILSFSLALFLDLSFFLIITLSFSLSHYLSLSLSFFLFSFPSISFFLIISLSLSLFLYLFIYLFFLFPLFLSFSLYFFLYFLPLSLYLFRVCSIFRQFLMSIPVSRSIQFKTDYG